MAAITGTAYGSAAGEALLTHQREQFAIPIDRGEMTQSALLLTYIQALNLALPAIEQLTETLKQTMSRRS
jgi:hypothetical protein